MPLPFPENIIAALGELNPTWFILAGVGILLDLLSGFVIKGVLTHAVSSSVMRQGLVHKAWEIAIISCAAVVDVAIMVGMDIGLQLVSTMTCGFILLMEIASVCENALEGNPELANAPIIRYVAEAQKKQQPVASTETPTVNLDAILPTIQAGSLHKDGEDGLQ